MTAKHSESKSLSINSLFKFKLKFWKIVILNKYTTYNCLGVFTIYFKIFLTYKLIIFFKKDDLNWSKYILHKTYSKYLKNLRLNTWRQALKKRHKTGFVSLLRDETSLNWLFAVYQLYFSNLRWDYQHVFSPVFSSPLRMNEADNGESDGEKTKKQNDSINNKNQPNFSCSR